MNDVILENSYFPSHIYITKYIYFGRIDAFV